MEFREQEFIPVLFGSDLGAYSMARAFYEEYGVKSQVYGKYVASPCNYSNIINYTANESIEEDETFLRIVNELAASTTKKLVIFGFGDSYLRLVSRNKPQLPANAVTPYVDLEPMDRLINKRRFYGLCEELGIDYPGTYVITRDQSDIIDMPFDFPIILKPADSADYFLHHFEGQNKVYKLNTLSEVRTTIAQIYSSGYSNDLIMQEYIPGDDSAMYVLTNYSSHDAKVRMMCLGHTLLEEHTPMGRGNHALIVTEHNEIIINQAKKLLEHVAYTGFSNLDIKYDRRAGTYRFFELNARQGRSNYYVTNAGINMAKLPVEDLVYGRNPEELIIGEPGHVWSVLPKGVAVKYANLKAVSPEAAQKIERGDFTNPLFMKGDLGLQRWARLMKNHLRQFGNYRTYYHPEEG